MAMADRTEGALNLLRGIALCVHTFLSMSAAGAWLRWGLAPTSRGAKKKAEDSGSPLERDVRSNQVGCRDMKTGSDGGRIKPGRSLSVCKKLLSSLG